MASKINVNPKPYVDAISRLYHGEGATRLKGLARIFEHELPSLDPKRDSKELSNRIVVLQVAIDAKKAYYSESTTGMISNGFNPSGQHYGIDIVAKKDEPIKAQLVMHRFFSRHLILLADRLAKKSRFI